MSPKNPATLARAVERHRKAAGLSQSALAKAIDVPASTIMLLERDDIEAPDPEKIERIAIALGIAPEELFASYPAPALRLTFAANERHASSRGRIGTILGQRIDLTIGPRKQKTPDYQGLSE